MTLIAALIGAASIVWLLHGQWKLPPQQGAFA